MAQYVNRKRRKKRRKLKSSFVIFCVIFLVLIGIICGAMWPFDSGNSPSSSDLSSDTSSEDASTSSDIISSEISSNPVSIPESSNVSYVSSESVTTNADLVTNKFVCEIVDYESETFVKNNSSDPRCTPLPIGTVDYCSGTIVGNGYSTTSSLYKGSVMLRYGKRVYVNSLQIKRSKVYDTSDYGLLPETNNVDIISGGNSADGRYSTLKLNVDWKAPFDLEIAPQAFTNAASRDYTISAHTCTYVDITFKYSSKIRTDDISNFNFTNTIFKSAEWKKNTSDYTLRLYLKETGKFYGWHAEYDSEGNLIFNFLNPAKVTVDSNGNVNLNGAKVFLDVGHGGVDTGANGVLNGTRYHESHLNLALAEEVKTYLEAMGATVIMSRTDNQEPHAAHLAMQKVRNAKPDYVLAIHHNSGGGIGMDAYHYYPYSSKATELIKNKTEAAGIYSKVGAVKWHVYYVGRVGFCPTVLTENGFVDNAHDLAIAVNPEKNKARAKALAEGVLDYFKHINGIS